jgi:hypothetical protein
VTAPCRQTLLAVGDGAARPSRATGVEEPKREMQAVCAIVRAGR